MNGVCRLCLADTTTYDGCTSYNERIQLLMPEIDLNITPTYILCEDCLNSLDRAYTFKQECLQNEKRIKNYISETQTPLIDLRYVKDQTYQSLDEVKVKIEEVYDDFESGNITNSANLEDCKDIHSISEEYHLTVVKEEIVQQYEQELTSKHCKEEIEEEENESLKAFVCEICKESFKRLTELDQHRIVHLTTNIHPSYDDHVNIDSISEKCHLTEESNSLQVFTCKICKTSFETSIDLERHKMVRSKTNIFPCDTCNKVFTRKINLAHHKIIHSNEAIRYFCDICNKGFKRKQNLDNHKDAHSNKMSTCSICSKSYRNLQYHMRDCHIRKHICEVCNMKFGTKSTLVKHMRTHTGDRPYKCEICGKGFAQKGTLDVHMHSHREKKPYMCNTCQKGYVSKVSLEAHMIVHMPNLEKPFVCEIITCSRRFKTTVGLRKHMRRHRLEKIHQCSLCDKGFSTPAYLKSHMKSHTGEKPYECDICRKKFSEKTNLGRHLKTHEPKKI